MQGNRKKISIPEVHCGNSTPTTDIVKLISRRSVWLTTLKLNVQQLLSLKSDRKNFTFLGPQELYERCCACVGAWVGGWSIFKTTLLLVRIHRRCRWRDGNIAKLYRFRFPHSALLLVRRTAPILPWSSRRHKLEGYPTAEPVYSKLSYGRDRQPARAPTALKALIAQH